MNNNAFAELRELLLAPSEEGWEAIQEYFEGLPRDDFFELALSYASVHLDTWPDAYRELQFELSSFQLLKGELYESDDEPPVGQDFRRDEALDKLGLFEAESIHYKNTHGEDFEEDLEDAFCFDESLFDESKAYLRKLARSVILVGEVTEEEALKFCDLEEFSSVRMVTMMGDFSKKGASVLMDTPLMRGLQELRISFAELNGALELLLRKANSAHLRNLFFGMVRFTADEVKLLAECSQLSSLERLDFIGCVADTRGIEQIALNPHFRHLRALSFDSCALQIDGLTLLLNAPLFNDLELLELSRNPMLGDEGAKLIAEHPKVSSLKELHMDDCHLGDAGCRWLAESPYLSNLHTLSLNTNDISCEGLFELSKGPILQKLCVLKLEENALKCEGIVRLCQQDLTQLRSLDLADNPFQTKGIQAIADSSFVRQLEYLDLGFACKETDKEGGYDLIMSRKLSNADTVALLSDAMLDKVSELSCSLRSLKQLQSILKLEAMSQLSSLEILCEHSGDRIVRDIADTPQLSRLKQLSLRDMSISDEGIMALVHSPYLTRLRYLDIENCDATFYGIHTLVQASNFQDIEELHLGELFMSVEDGELFLGCEEKMGFDDFQALLSGRHIQKVHSLECEKLTFKQLAFLTEEVLHPMIRTLELDEGSFGDEGVLLLANCPQIANLERLSLIDCELGDIGAKAIAESPYLGKLSELQLCNNHIGDLGIEALATSQNLLQLLHLDLEDNQVGFIGAMAIANSRIFTLLEELDLEDNEIGQKGVRIVEDSRRLENLEAFWY